MKSGFMIGTKTSMDTQLELTQGEDTAGLHATTTISKTTLKEESLIEVIIKHGKSTVSADSRQLALQDTMKTHVANLHQAMPEEVVVK